jgi:hypothetical protein
MKAWFTKGAVAALLIGSFFAWHEILEYACASPVYWRQVDAATRADCAYASLPSLFKLQPTNDPRIIIVGDQDFIRTTKAIIGGTAPSIGIDTCIHDLRDVQNVLGYPIRLIGEHESIVIQTGPQMWTNPGFYGTPLKVLAWTAAQRSPLINKPLLQYCASGIEDALQAESSHKLRGSRPRIDGRTFSTRADYVARLTKTLQSHYQRTIWLDDRELTGTNAEFIASYDDFLSIWPSSLGQLARNGADLRAILQAQFEPDVR